MKYSVLILIKIYIQYTESNLYVFFDIFSFQLLWNKCIGVSGVDWKLKK